MARGKHKLRAERRRQEEFVARRDELAERERREVDAQAHLIEELAELDSLIDEVSELRDAVARIRSDEADGVRAEIGQLLREIVQLQAAEHESFRRRNRRMSASANTYRLSAVEIMEMLADGHEDLEGVVVTDGVPAVAARKLGVEAIEAIQRARGLRRGKLGRARQRLERIAQEEASSAEEEGRITT